MLASSDVVGTKVELRYDPFDISHIYAYVHNHWVECITSQYGLLHGHSERELILATAELREQNRRSHIRTPIDAKRLADFLAKIEAHEAVLLARQRDIENQAVLYRIEQTKQQARGLAPGEASPRMAHKQRDEDSASSRFAPVDLTTLQTYGEYR